VSGSGDRHNLLKIIGDIRVYADFKMFKVKVPNLSLVSARRDGRYEVRARK
jgi:hypothetical protein